MEELRPRQLIVYPGEEFHPSLSVGAGLPVDGHEIIVISIDDWEDNGMEGYDMPFRLQPMDPKNNRPQQFSVGTTEGFAIHTVSGDGSKRSILADSLEEALRLISEAATYLTPPPGLWLPLMGAGHGRLRYKTSAEITARVLRDTNPQVARITVTGPANMDESDLEDVGAAFNRILSEADQSQVKSGRDLSSKIDLAASSTVAGGSSAETDNIDASSSTATTEPDELATHAEYQLEQPAQSSDDDLLDRDVIAEAIFRQSRQIWVDAMEDEKNKTRRPKRPYNVHIAGRWGSGKSSILNFLRDHLAADDGLALPRGGMIHDIGKTWVVVDFNAWRQQDQGPAWWALLNTVRTEAVRQLRPYPQHSQWLNLQHWRFRFLRGWWHVLAAALFTLAIVLAITIWGFINPARPETAESTPLTIFLSLSPVLTATLGAMSFWATFMRGSQKTAEQFADLDDPTQPLKERFDAMIREIHRPVAVFIDDLDRCDASYVVELLQAIQTIYIDTPVLYVVASDRDWIVSAYDQTYQSFKSDIDKPGQPLGHLFVEKIFQLSVKLPDLTDAYGTAFLKSHLPIGDDEDETTEPDEDALKQRIGAAETLAEAEAIVAEQTSPAARRTAGRAAFLQSIDAGQQKKIEHLLVKKLTSEEGLIDLNPRAIKRLVNAFSFRRGYALSTGNLDVINDLPYWCAFDLRFPYAAKRLIEAPSLLAGGWQDPAEAEYFPPRDHATMSKLLDKLQDADIRTLASFG